MGDNALQMPRFLGGNLYSYLLPDAKAINELGLVTHGVTGTLRDTGESLMRLRVIRRKWSEPMGSAMKVRVDGATLHVEIDGDENNPALLLWPPGTCTVRTWDHLVPRLAERFRVVRIDIRGLGESSPAADPDTQYTFEQYAQDACDVLDHLGIERCHVWSQSWGSRPAMVFCAFNPDRVIYRGPLRRQHGPGRCGGATGRDQAGGGTAP